MTETLEPDDNPNRSIHLSCHLQITEDITLISIRAYNENPLYIHLKKGTSVTLINDKQLFCSTNKGCDSGPLVRIEQTNGVDVPEEHIRRAVIVPARFLAIHPTIL